MGTCWYCHWGWPKIVADIYTEALKRLDGYDSPLDFGPAHIVWGDENFESAEWCLDNFEKYKGDYTPEELEVVKWSLIELAKLPLDIRDIWPEDYDDEHPELFPPPPDIIMTKKHEI